MEGRLELDEGSANPVVDSPVALLRLTGADVLELPAVDSVGLLEDSTTALLEARTKELDEFLKPILEAGTLELDRPKPVVEAKTLELDKLVPRVEVGTLELDL